MAAVRVQGASAVGTAVASVTPTLGAGSTAGNCLIAKVSIKVATATLTVTMPANWVQACWATDTASTNSPKTGIWYYPNCPAGITSVQCSLSSGTGDMAADVEEWSGLTTTSPKDQHQTSVNSTAVTAIGTGTTPTTTQADELLIANLAWRNPASVLSSINPTDFTKNVDIFSTNSAGASATHHNSYSKIVSATGAYVLDGTLATARQYAGAIATFKIAAGGTPHSLTNSLDAVLQKNVSKTNTLDAMLQKQGVTKTSSANAILQKNVSLTNSLDAWLQGAAPTVTTSLNALLQKNVSKTNTLDAWLLKTLSRTANLDAALRKNVSITASLDALLRKTVSTTTALNAALSKVSFLTSSLNALLQATKSLTSNLDASLQLQGITKTATFDAFIEGPSALLAAIAVQTQTASYSGVVSPSVTLTNLSENHNTLIAWVTVEEGAANVDVLVPSPWQVAIQAEVLSGAPKLMLLYYPDAPPMQTLTLQLSVASDIALEMVEWRNLPRTLPLDRVISGVGDSLTADTGPLVDPPTQANHLLLGCIANRNRGTTQSNYLLNGVTPWPTAGIRTAITTLNANQTNSCRMVPLRATGASTPNWQLQAALSISRPWAAGLAVFKIAVAGTAHIQATSFDAVLMRVVERQASLNAHLQKRMIQTQFLDAHLRGNISITSLLNATLRKTISLTATTDAALRKNVTRVTSIDGLLRKTVSRIVSLDARLIPPAVIPGTKTTNLNAVLRKTVSTTASADAVLANKRIATASLNALLARVGVRTANLDATLAFGRTRLTALDAQLKARSQASCSFDAVIADAWKEIPAAPSTWTKIS